MVRVVADGKRASVTCGGFPCTHVTVVLYLPMVLTTLRSFLQSFFIVMLHLSLGSRSKPILEESVFLFKCEPRTTLP